MFAFKLEKVFFKALILLFSNKKPAFPELKNSFGPFGQFEDTTKRFDNAASTITKPTSSQSEESTKISALTYKITDYL